MVFAAVFVVFCSLIIYGTASYARMVVICFYVTRVQSHSTKNASNWRLFLMESGVVQYVLVCIILFFFIMVFIMNNAGDGGNTVSKHLVTQ